jgi:hypothetical protein
MFEVQDLKYATLATVSRCGMVWFSEDVLTSEIIFEHYLARLRHVPLEDVKKDVVRTPSVKKIQSAYRLVIAVQFSTVWNVDWPKINRRSFID